MCTGRSRVTRRALAFTSVMSTLLCPQLASAQQSDQWQFTVAPLYLWATEINGAVTARHTTVPVFLEFADAADNLAGAFSFHVEARKGRWGGFSDLNFVRLSSDSQFTVGTGGTAIDGNFQFDNTTFEAGGSYLVREGTPFAVIGGLRTYSISPKLEFTTPSLQLTPIDASRTSVNVFAGFTFRPQIAEKWMFVSRADIGGGGGFTWSGMLGVEFRPRPQVGLVLGYKGFGIDVGSDSDDHVIREYDLTYYGPVFGLNLHFGGK
jgi:hypothetical protein